MPGVQNRRKEEAEARESERLRQLQQRMLTQKERLKRELVAKKARKGHQEHMEADINGEIDELEKKLDELIKGKI